MTATLEIGKPTNRLNLLLRMPPLKFGKERGDHLSLFWMKTLPGYFRQRGQDKKPIRHAWMRDRKVAITEDQIIIEEKIKIKRPVQIPVQSVIALSTEFLFDTLQQIQKIIPSAIPLCS